MTALFSCEIMFPALPVTIDTLRLLLYKHEEFGGTVGSTVVSEQESPELESSIWARPRGHMWCNTHDQ